MCNRLPEITKNGDAGIFPVYYSLKKQVDRLIGTDKKGANTGVFASKYNYFGINTLRYETAAVHIAPSSKRKKSAYSCIFVQREVLGFEVYVPRFGGHRLFGSAGVFKEKPERA